MTTYDALFEDIQALSDDAEFLGLTDVALVLEFAMDVFLHQTKDQRANAMSVPEFIANSTRQMSSCHLLTVKDRIDIDRPLLPAPSPDQYKEAS